MSTSVWPAESTSLRKSASGGVKVSGLRWKLEVTRKSKVNMKLEMTGCRGNFIPSLSKIMTKIPVSFTPASTPGASFGTSFTLEVPVAEADIEGTLTIFLLLHF